jgi:enoyl-CoA hydratase/carnithine racemase
MFDISWLGSGAVAAVRLNRPPANAIGLVEINELEQLVDRLATAPTVRAALFYTQLRFFSAGADIELMGASMDAPDGPEKLAHLSERMQTTFAKIEALPIPTVAAIAGVCVGGGLELALACDIRIAERSARIGLPEVKLGLIPGAGGTQRLARLCGVAAAKRLILTGDLISGEDAHDLGIVQELASGMSAYEASLELAHSFAEAPRRSLAAIKRCIALAPSAEGYAAEIAETLALHREPETKARIEAFLARSRSKKVAV